MISTVREALTAIDAFEAPNDETFESRMEHALQENPNLIVPFCADEDVDSEFTLTVKKCRKPRANAATAAAAKKAPPAPLLTEKPVVLTTQVSETEVTPQAEKK